MRMCVCACVYVCCTCVYVYVRVYACLFVWVRVRAYFLIKSATQRCMDTQISIHVYVITQFSNHSMSPACMHPSIHAFKHISTHPSINYACIRIRVCVYAPVYIHTRTCISDPVLACPSPHADCFNPPVLILVMYIVVCKPLFLSKI